MLNIFLFFLSSIFSNNLENSSWVLEKNGTYEVRIYSDKFFSISKYNMENNFFIETSGGIYSMSDIYYEIIEFNSSDSSLVGDTIFYSDISFNIDNGINVMEINGKKFIKNHDEDQLSGAYLMSGIERNNIMRMREVNKPRKTMKLLSGNRFQWISYDTSKRSFYGSGGGTYTAVNGKYIENIEFFSRDSNSVGKSLEFDYEIKDGDWHHTGFSSKGDPKYEIWTHRKN